MWYKKPGAISTIRGKDCSMHLCSCNVTCFPHLLSLYVAIIESLLKSAIHGIDMEIVQALSRNGELFDIDSNFSWGITVRKT